MHKNINSFFIYTMWLNLGSFASVSGVTLFGIVCFVEEPNDRGLFFSERKKTQQCQSINITVEIVFMISGGPYLFH